MRQQKKTLEVATTMSDTLHCREREESPGNEITEH